MIWNNLPDEVCSATSLSSFRKKLKSYLFPKAYPPSCFASPVFHHGADLHYVSGQSIMDLCFSVYHNNTIKYILREIYR